MTKKDFDARLKNDADANGIKIEGDCVVFDKTSNLSYELIKGLTLGDLLTANPFVSLTRLNKNLLLLVNDVLEKYGQLVTVRASYHSPEYDKLCFGTQDSTLYTTGCALSIAVPSDQLEALKAAALDVFTIKEADSLKAIGEVGFYSWGVHLGYTKEQHSWDYSQDNSFKQKIKDFIKYDKMKNIALIAAAGVAAWFFIFRKK